MAIIGLMVTATIPAIGNFTASSERTRFLTEVSTLLESARQHAIAQNTYVWVAFGEKDTTLYAAAIASRDGLSQGYGPEESWSSQTIPLAGSSDFVAVSRVIALGDYQISIDSGNFGATPGFTTTQGGNGDLDLSRSVQFSPSGEARTGPGIRGNLVFDAQASEGSFADVEETIIVNGPTGFTSVVSND